MRRIVCHGLMFVYFNCYPLPCFAATFNIYPGQSIQSAIDSASNGDTIIVHQGTFNQILDLKGKALHLKSSNGPLFTTLDGTGLGKSIITIASGEGTNTIIEGFKLTKGEGTARIDTLTGLPMLLGGAMLIENSAPRIENCIFEQNIILNDFDVNTIVSGAGIHIEASNPIISNSKFIANGQQSDGCEGTSGGGGIHSRRFSFTKLINCEFYNNHAYRGGALSSSEYSELQVTNSIFKGNNAISNGGAIFSGVSNLTTIYNSLIYENTASTAAGISIYSLISHPFFLINSTIVNNHATSFNGTGGLKNWSGFQASVHNSIIWNNTQNIHSTQPWLRNLSGLFTVRHSIIEDGYDGEDIISSDPLFSDPSNNDFTLSVGSPAINAGSSALYGTGPDFDLANNPRIQGEQIDIGAYERIDASSMICGDGICSAGQGEDASSCPVDCLVTQPQTCDSDINSNGIVDLQDLLIVLANWGPCSGCLADLSGNDSVGFEDLLLLFQQWGMTTEDCFPVIACGDGICQASENCLSCPLDCSPYYPWPLAWMEFENTLFDLINQKRSTGATCHEGYMPPVGQLVANNALRWAARCHNLDMSINGINPVNPHQGSDGSWPWQRAQQAGYPSSSVGENIAWNTYTPGATLSIWLASTTGHCALLMNPNFQHLGLGFVMDDTPPQTRYWTANFGFP